MGRGGSAIRPFRYLKPAQVLIRGDYSGIDPKELAGLPDSFPQRLQKLLRGSNHLHAVRLSLHILGNPDPGAAISQPAHSAGAPAIGIHFGDSPSTESGSSVSFQNSDVSMPPPRPQKCQSSPTSDPADDDIILHVCFNLCELTWAHYGRSLAWLDQKTGKDQESKFKPYDDAANRRFVCHWVAFSWEEKTCYLLPRDDAGRTYAVGPEHEDYARALAGGGAVSSSRNSHFLTWTDIHDVSASQSEAATAGRNEATTTTTNPLAEGLLEKCSGKRRLYRLFKLTRDNTIALPPAARYSASQPDAGQIIMIGHYTPRVGVVEGPDFRIHGGLGGFRVLFSCALLGLFLLNSAVWWALRAWQLGGGQKCL